VLRFDGGRICEISDRPRHTKDRVMRSCRQAEVANRLMQDAPSRS